MRRRHSSVVEQLFRKQQVLSSNLSVGSSDLNSDAGLRTGFFVARRVPCSQKCSRGYLWPMSRRFMRSAASRWSLGATCV